MPSLSGLKRKAAPQRASVQLKRSKIDADQSDGNHQNHARRLYKSNATQMAVPSA